VDREGRYPNLPDQRQLTTALVNALSSSKARALINELYDDMASADARGLLQPRTKRPRREIQHQHRLEADERQRLIEAFKDGATFEELAERFGIHRTTVRAYLDRAGLDFLPYGAKLTAVDVERAAWLYLDGLSLASVGQYFDVDAETIRSALKRAGVPIRPRKGSVAWSQLDEGGDGRPLGVRGVDP
jgi:DNA-directed RNA polymerase specialized sigma24 family protein